MIVPAWLDDALWTYQNLIHALGVNGLLALSMYVVLSVGQLSLGQAAFMGLGAYSSALMTLQLKLPFYAVLPLSCITPVLFALLIGVPTLRLSGVYLAIATIGLGEVLRAVYLNVDLFGGPLGVNGIPESAETWMIYALLGGAVALLWLVGRSRVGRAMEAMREDEIAAQVMGVNLWRYRLGALVASAALAGIAGCLNAHVSDFIGPNEYGFEPAVTILSYALLGGIGTPIAPVLGAWVLTLLPELLRGVSDVRLVVNGLIIVAAVLFLPGGAVSVAVASGMMKPLLELRGVSRRYAGLVAVDNVDMHVEAGGIHALIGPNGAGKTTLFNLISGIVSVSAGRIRLGGADVTRLPAHRRAKLRLARTFQNIRIFGAMTVRENVLTGLHAHFINERAARTAADEALELVGLADGGRRRADTLSYGDQRRVELARAMAGRPLLLLLDEPAAGMNPAETEALAALVRQLPVLGTTVLLVEHDMNFIMGLADEITVLNFGRRICVGPPAAVRADPQVIEAYLGHGTSQSAVAVQRRAASAPLLTVEQLCVTYGRTMAVRRIDLTVREGQVVCLIGANGAGKTTTLRALSGLTRTSGGRILFAGQDITRQSTARIAGAGLLQVPEGRQVFPELTVAENLALGGYLVRDRSEIVRRLDQVLVRFPRLRERLNQQAGLLSGGEQQMLAMARALMGGPRMLLLDEPSMGLAPQLIDEIFGIIAELRREGTTILLVEQNAAAALMVADFAYVLETGRIVLAGPAGDVANDPAVIKAYLGASA